MSPKFPKSRAQNSLKNPWNHTSIFTSLYLLFDSHAVHSGSAVVVQKMAISNEILL
jgi:hypothetical protein